MQPFKTGGVDRLSVVALIALYVCWGAAIPAMKVMVATVPPVGGAAAVFLGAGVLMASVGLRRTRPRAIARLVGAGVLLLVGGQGLAIVALSTVTASLGAILAAAIPLWVVLLGGLLGAPVSKSSLVRLAVGFVGIAILVLTAPHSAVGGRPWGVIAFCVAPALWAAGTLVAASLDPPVDPLGGNSIQLLSGGGSMLLIAGLRGELDPHRWLDASPGSLAALAFLVLFDSIAGFLLFTFLLQRAHPALVSTYAYITPLIGTLLGATLLHEPLWTGALVGAPLVLCAVALELSARRLRSTRPAEHGPGRQGP